MVLRQDSKIAKLLDSVGTFNSLSVQPVQINPEVQEGRHFVASSAAITINDSLLIKWENPSDSGVRCAVDKFIPYNSSGVIPLDLTKNPSWSPTDSEKRTPENSKADGPAPEANFYASDTTDTLGGTSTDIVVASDSSLDPYDVNNDIPPGASLGLNHGTGDLSSIDTAHITLSWVEYPV